MIGWRTKTVNFVEFTIESEDGRKFKLQVDEKTHTWFCDLTPSEQQMVLGMVVKRYNG